MELDKVLARVRALVAKAEAPIAGGATEAEREATRLEQEAARKLADQLMLKYAIDEITSENSQPASSHQKPGIIVVSVGGYTDILGHVAYLSSVVAAHCRCKIRHYSQYDYQEREWQSKVYGFESDLRYFEILYTTLRLHMLGAILPKPDPSKSLEQNAYILHNAGLNWYDIAQMYGWRETLREPGDSARHMYQNKNTGERLPWSKAVGVYERAYKKEIKARGEAPLRIPPRGKETFRKSAAEGYTQRISQRLREARGGRATGSEIILRSRLEDIEKFFKEDNPDMFEENPEENQKPIRQKKYVPPPFSHAGYSTGVNHANTASLNPQAAAAKKGEIS